MKMEIYIIRICGECNKAVLRGKLYHHFYILKKKETRINKVVNSGEIVEKIK